MWRMRVRDLVLSVAALSGAAPLCLGACVSVRGKDFAARYAGQCASEPAPFAQGVVQEGPAVEAARGALADRAGDQSDALRRCYEEGLANVARMQGRVRLRLTVNRQGKLENVGVAENTMGYEAFACCIASVVSGFTLPPSAAGAVGLEYPFAFELVRMPVGVRDAMGPDFVDVSAKPEGFSLRLDGKMYGDP